MTLVDTSAWVEALREDGQKELQQKVATLLAAGSAVLCPMVSLELWNGAGDQAERAKVRRLVQELPGLTISPDVWEHAADLAQKSRARGLTVPATDLIIASTARVHGVALLHADRHFDLIEETSG